MKILTTNFLTCAVKSCKTSSLSFPLHFKDAILERTELDYNPLFIKNILPRINWDALKITVTELGLLQLLPEKNPTDIIENKKEGNDDEDDEDNTMKEAVKEEQEEEYSKLHKLLLETSVMEGKLLCQNCGFEYPIKDGVGNFLLPSHLV